MPKPIDITGNKYHRVTVLFEIAASKGNRKWRCRCDCGTEFDAFQNGLRDGNTKSCGCLQRETASKTFKKHGYCNHKLYSVRKAMIARCNDTRNVQFENYGGRGISVCNEWRKSPFDFIDWAIKNGWRDGLEIDRINNDGNYEPSNCRFVDRKTNCSNTRRCIYVYIDGVRSTLSDAARKVGLTPKAVHSRVKRGTSPSDALWVKQQRP